MISLLVDEAYAFDFLSIVDVKRKKSNRDQNTFKDLCIQIETQIDKDLFKKIMESKVYAQMVEVNQNIYNMIDLMRDDIVELDAKVIDDANTERYRLKKRLQDEFFMSELVETKTKL